MIARPEKWRRLLDRPLPPSKPSNSSINNWNAPSKSLDSAASYSRAPPSARRLLNHGLFKKLFIGEDGSVEHAEVQELFAGILSRDASITTEVREVTMLMPPKQHEVFGAPLAASGTDEHLVPVGGWGNSAERRRSTTTCPLRFPTRQTVHMREPRPGSRVDGVLG